MTETSRDLLRDLLVSASNMSDLDDQLDFYGFTHARIRAAIEADDAAQRIAGEMPELRRRHARAAVEGAS